VCRFSIWNNKLLLKGLGLSISYCSVILFPVAFCHITPSLVSKCKFRVWFCLLKGLCGVKSVGGSDLSHSIKSEVFDDGGNIL
jgi:hypothetical protein